MHTAAEQDHGSHFGRAAPPGVSRAIARRWHAARCIGVSRDARTMGAIGRRLRLLARHGQNDPVISMGRKAWLFFGSELAGKRAAIVMSLVQSAKLKGHDP